MARSVEPEAAVYRLLSVRSLDDRAMRQVLTAWRQEPGLMGTFWGRPASEYRTAYGVSQRASRFLAEEAVTAEDGATAPARIAAAQAAELELLTLLDSSYARLAEACGLPPVLFTRGNQDLLWSSGAAVPHSKDASEEALSWGAALAGALATAGIGLVSGHNRDGYRRVAAAAKRAQSPLLLALDRPLHGALCDGPRAEPVVTARLWDDQFRRERELIVSAIRPGETWRPSHAQARDALVVQLAAVVVAGAVRPGGTMARLCQRAVNDGRPVFRSPFCRAELGAALLPMALEPAAEIVARAFRADADEMAASRPLVQCPSPGWVERRWAAEVAAFVSSLEAMADGRTWTARHAATSLENRDGPERQALLRNEIVAIVHLPKAFLGEGTEVVVVGRHGDGPFNAAKGAPVLALSPGEPVRDLETLRSYLARCLQRVQAALRTPRL